MPRITPITSKSELPAEGQHAADAVLKVFGRIRGPFSMLLHSPSLAERLLPMVKFVREDTIVEPRLRFPAILTAASECGAEYVWSAQVELARKNGIREPLIDVIRAKGDPGDLHADEREIVTYTRELIRNRRPDDTAFAALSEQYGSRWLVELTATVQFFAFVSGICSAFDVPPPPDGDRLTR